MISTDKQQMLARVRRCGKNWLTIIYSISSTAQQKKSHLFAKRLQTKAKFTTDYTAENDKLFIFANFVRTNNVNQV